MASGANGSRTGFDTIKEMFRLFALSVCSVVCFAQTPADLFNRPPVEVDRALRARITEFYQDHVEGKSPGPHFNS